MVNNISLVIKNLSYSYGEKIALSNINWTLHAGSIHVLLGPNGAGKTTFLNLLANVIPPTSGSITAINSHSKEEIDKKTFEESIGFLQEYSYFYPFLTAAEMIRLVGQLKGLEADLIEVQMNKWLDYFELNKYRNQQMDSLSQGTKKRIALINAIIHQPKILLLDEPTNGLDPEQIVLFRTVLKELSNSGALILLSTHIIDLAEKLADKVGIIRGNQLVYKGDNTGHLENLYLTVQ